MFPEYPIIKLRRRLMPDNGMKAKVYRDNEEQNIGYVERLAKVKIRLSYTNSEEKAALDKASDEDFLAQFFHWHYDGDSAELERLE